MSQGTVSMKYHAHKNDTGLKIETVRVLTLGERMGNWKMDGMAPSLKRVVCPVLSKSSGLKWQLQTIVRSLGSKPFLLSAADHACRLCLSFGNLNQKRYTCAFVTTTATFCVLNYQEDITSTEHAICLQTVVDVQWINTQGGLLLLLTLKSAVTSSTLLQPWGSRDQTCRSFSTRQKFANIVTPPRLT